MRFKKVGLLLVFLSLFVLLCTACDIDLKKPSGLETTHDSVRGVEEEEAVAAVDAGHNQTIIQSIVTPDDVIIPPTEQVIAPGETVLSALIYLTRAEQIQLHFQGSGARGYVVEIDHVRERGAGPGSGWIYLINGALPDRSAGAITLCPGDRVEWIYTKTLGTDSDVNCQPFERERVCEVRGD